MTFKTEYDSIFIILFMNVGTTNFCLKTAT